MEIPKLFRNPLLGVVALTSAVVPLASMGSQVYLAYVFGGLGNLSWLTLMSLAAYSLALQLIAAAFQLTSGVINPMLANDLIKELRDKLQVAVYSKLLPTDLTEQGSLSTRMSSDIPSFVLNRLSVIQVLSSSIATAGFLVVFGVTANSELALIWMMSIPFYLLPIIFQNKLQTLARRSLTAWGDALTGFLLFARSSESLKLLLNKTPRPTIFGSWASVQVAATRESRTRNVLRWMQTFTQSLITIVMAVVGISIVTRHILPATSIMAFIILQQRVGPIVTSITEMPLKVSYIRLSKERIEPYFSAPTYHLATGSVPTSISVVVKNLSVHVEDQPLLSDCSFEWPSKGVVLVTGPNGAGKTQLLKCILGLTVMPGDNVRWNDSVANATTYVPQDVVILRASLRDNIRLGEEVTDQALMTILSESGWSNASLNSFCSDDRSLSGGEKKRIAVARALIRRPKCIVLDEVEAGVSTPGELIATVLRRVPLVVAVTHHPDLWPRSSIRYAIHGSRVERHSL